MEAIVGSIYGPGCLRHYQKEEKIQVLSNLCIYFDNGKNMEISISEEELRLLKGKVKVAAEEFEDQIIIETINDHFPVIPENAKFFHVRRSGWVIIPYLRCAVNVQ